MVTAISAQPILLLFFQRLSTRWNLYTSMRATTNITAAMMKYTVDLDKQLNLHYAKERMTCLREALLVHRIMCRR